MIEYGDDCKTFPLESHFPWDMILPVGVNHIGNTRNTNELIDRKSVV